MSRYAWLVNPSSNRCICLGKMYNDEVNGQVYLSKSSVPNSGNVLLMKAVMKFLADAIDGTIMVLSEEAMDAWSGPPLSEYAERGTAEFAIEDYIDGFPG